MRHCPISFLGRGFLTCEMRWLDFGAGWGEEGEGLWGGLCAARGGPVCPEALGKGQEQLRTRDRSLLQAPRLVASFPQVPGR